MENIMKMTYRLAHAIGADTANRQMRASGRAAWNEEDYDLAARTFNDCFPRCAQLPGIEPGLCGCKACHDGLAAATSSPPRSPCRTR